MSVSLLTPAARFHLPPSPSVVEEDHLTKIADIADLRMTKTKLPDHERSVQDDGSHDDSHDKTRNQPQNRVGVGEGHNGQTDILGEQQRCCLLPAASPVLDGVAGFESNLLSNSDTDIGFAV